MKSMRLKRFVVITLSLMMLFSSMSPSLISVSFAAEDGENSEVENIVNNVLTYTNADTEDVQKGDSDAYTITVTGEDNFAEGSSIYISEIQKNELKGYMDDLNTYLEKEMLSAKAVLPLSIDLFDLNGNTIQPGQEVDVAISLLDAAALKKTMLYHQKEDGTWEKVAYKILETNEGASIEFNVDSFSPFIFVNEIEVEPTKEEGSDDKNIEPNSESKKEDVNEQTASEKKQPEKVESDSKDTKDNKVEGANEIKEPTKKADNKADDSIARDNSAVQSQKDDVEAISLYGDAAKDEGEAIDALKKDLLLSRKDAKNVANDLFNVKAAKGATRGEDEDVPRQGDGSNIENISAKWITDDTVDNGDSSLLYYKPSGDSSFDVRLQINYALSGEHNYDPGDITITIPENIFKNRTGKYACEVILPYPEDPSTKADFNWKLVDGNYVFTNTKRMSAATKGYIQVGFAGLTPHDLVDMKVSEDFDAYIEVTTHKGNIIALHSNKLNAQIDTEAKLVDNSVRKSNRTVERVPASEIPANQRVNGEEEYILVTWYVYGSMTANTWYTLDSVDSIPQNASVTNDLKESDVHGFIVGATSGNGIELTKDNMYHGYSSGQTSYYSFKTAYPASQFEPNVVYTFHNKIHMTVTEDDPIAEVTNPNVQAEDPQLVTEGEYTAQTTWSYRLPEWNNPTGHFMVCKNGNDNKVGNNQTHHSSHPGGSSSDIHIWKNKSPIDMWYGIYPSGMNDLDEGKDMYLSYTIDSVGYTMPWMFNEASYETDGELAARKAINYNLPVTMITEDTGVHLGNSKQKLTVHEDFEFVSIEFPPTPYVYTGKPKNINPDGTWEALTAGDGTFEYKLDSNYSHYPDIMLEIYRNGGWEEYATASWKTGSVKITLANGDIVSGAIVDLPSDTENFRTQVTVQNTLDENLSNVISQAAIDYDVRPVIKLYNTDAVKALVTAGFEATHTPSMYVYNGVNMKAYDSNNAEIVSIDKEGYDVLRGYTTDVTVYPSKTVRQTLKDADYVNRQVTLHYSAKVEERSVINDKKTYEQAVEDGRLAAETHGFWYDLLPRGVTPDISSVTLRSGDKLLSVRTEENYKNSGRTLLIVEVELKPTPVRYRSGDMYYYEDVPSISFDAWYAFDALTDYGKSIHNVIAFESSNDHIGTVDGYSGEPDNPNTGEDNNVSTHLAFSTNDEKTWMTDLDEERDDPSFVYAGVSNTIDIISAARLSLQKDVMVNNDGRWGTGVFNSDLTTEGGEPSYTYNENSKAENEMVVWEGGLYSYKLRMMPDDETRAKDMVIYDSLETFKAGDGNEPIDEIAANEDATWQGEFMGVDVNQLKDVGCAPVVYYSTIPNLALSDETNPEVGNRANMLFNEDNTINDSVWIRADQYDGDLSAVTAIAVDASKKTDGSDFTLEPLESIVVLINMRAPSGDEARDIIANNGPWGTSAYAYNNAYLTGTTIDIDTLDEDNDNFVRKDYTKVGLVEYQYHVKKVWNDDNNRDGMRPENITVHLLADGTDTGESLLVNADNDWKASFEHIPYTTPDGKKIKYSVLEDEVTSYSTDITCVEASSTITNSHVPEKISLIVNKNWRNDTEQDRPDYITIELYGNGQKVTSKRIDDSTNWTCTFTDLFKNENGVPIRYTAKETFPNGDVKHLSYIANEPDGLVLVGLLTPEVGPDFGDPLSIREDEDHVFTNTYHPYGDLYVNKNVTNVTSVSAEQDFEFTFDFFISEDGEDVPVLDEYDYDVLDDADHVVSSGKISNNGTISIKGGQRIHVKEMDEYVKYKVTEKEEEGFKQANAVNTEGIVSPNSDAVVSFDNNYSAKGNFNPVVEKTLKNRELRKYQFKFEMYQIFEEQDDNGTVTTTENLIRTATSGKPDDPVLREDGTVESSRATATFGAIKYTQEDVNTQAELGKPYRYKIVEVKSDKAGYTYDETVYYVDVAVTDNGDGTLNIVPTYYKEIPPEEGGVLDGLGDLIFGEDDPTYEEVEEPIFINEYKAEGEIVLRAWKDLQGRKLTDGEFEFELLDENGQPVYKVNSETGEPTDEPMTATNTEDGSIVFEALKFDETDIGKTFNYAICEKTGTDGTVNYAENIYGYSIIVYDNGDGTLSFSQTPATPIFNERDCEECGGAGIPSENPEVITVTDPEHPFIFGSGVYNNLIQVEGRPVHVPELSYSFQSGGDWWPSNIYPFVSEMANGEYEYAFDQHMQESGTYWIDEDCNVVSSITVKGKNTTLANGWKQILMDRRGYSQEQADELIDENSGGAFVMRFVKANFDSYGGYYRMFYDLQYIKPCEVCEGIGSETVIAGWNTDEGELPVFKNTLKDGSLSVTKNIANPDEADPTQKFKFKVKLIGDNIEDKEFDYELSQANNRKTFTVRVVDSETGNPIPDIGVLLTNDYNAPYNSEDVSLTNEDGLADFGELNAGEYYFWINSTPIGDYVTPFEGSRPVAKKLIIKSDGSGDVTSYPAGEVEATNIYEYEWSLEKTIYESLAKHRDLRTSNIDTNIAEKVAISDNVTSTDNSKSSKGLLEKIIPPVYAAENNVFTITYNSNSGGIFDNDETTNVVTYEQLDEKYSHTSNVSDTGAQNGNYGKNLNTNEVVSIPGATSLTVDLYYNGENTSYDWLSVWAGNHPDYRASSNTYSEGCATTEMGAPSNYNKFGGRQTGSYTVNGNSLTSMGHCTLTIPGDSVTFGFKSDSSGYGAGYGYYAIVSACKKTGEYKVPDSTVYRMRFKEWTTSQDGTGDKYKTEDEVMKGISESRTLYAQYESSLLASGTWWKLWADGELELIGSDSADSPVAMPALNYDSPWNSYAEKIKTVTTTGYLKAGSTMNGMFNSCRNLETADLSGIADMSSVTSMSGMFYECTKLKDITWNDSLNTANVTRMNEMFYNCSSLEQIDLSHFNTGNVTTMSGMFKGCESLGSLDLSSFDTSNVNDMSNMFNNCSSLETLDLTPLNTENVTNMNGMFCECSGLEELDASPLNTDNVTNMGGMFSSCSSLKIIDLDSFNTEKVTNMGSMFNGCSSLENIDLTSFNTEKVTNMGWMFNQCSSLSSIDVSMFDTSNVTDMNAMFSGCTSLESLDVSDFDTGKVTRMGSMFSGCGKLTSLDLSDFNMSNVTSTSSMFSECSLLSDLDISGWSNLQKLENAAEMFAECDALESIVIENWNTTKLTTVGGMFRGCDNLRSADVRGLNVSKVQSLENFFRDCKSLIQVDTTSWNISSVKRYNDMFNGCTSMKRLDLSHFNTMDKNNMWLEARGMFAHMPALEYLDISNFQTTIGGDVFIADSWKENVGNVTDWQDPTDTSLKTIKISSKLNVSDSSFDASLGGPANGSHFKFPTPHGDEYTGKWIREDESYGPYTPDEFKEAYRNDRESLAGTWVWEENNGYYYVSFSADGSTGSMARAKFRFSDDCTLPENQLAKFGYEFDHWDDGNGHTYADKGTIPAGTYEGGDFVTLTAVFVPRDTTVNMENGEFEFELYGGETATFNDIPAGTTYQVYEETPDGWVLIEQSNTSGKIEPLETSEASFTNKYEPGTATSQFFGTKTLDGQAAEADSYSFILDETTEGAAGTVKMLVDGEEQNVELPYTVTVSEGGFIQFPAIKYSIDDIGEHTYTVKEVNPNDDRIDYDTHVETIKVNVTGDVTELKAETVIDEDGDGKISFANKTRPGELRITKNGQNVTDANKDDEFTFKVTLSSDTGLPFTGNDVLDWYTVDSSGNVIQSENDNDNNGQKGNESADNVKPSNVKLKASSIARSFNAENKISLKNTGNLKTGPSKSGSRSTEGTAYAVLDNSGNLIFFRSNDIYTNDTTGAFTDILGNTYTGRVFADIETTNDIGPSSCKWDNYRTNIKTVKVADGQTIQPIICDCWFYGCTNMTSCDLEGLDTGSVTDMSGMFSDCSSLISLDVSGFDTGNVMEMDGMFSGCSHLTSLDVSGFDTSDVWRMNYMFAGCSGLANLDVSGFDTSKVEHIEYMFSGCSGLTSLDVSRFDTSEVKYMRNMFYNCSALTSLDLSRFDTSKVQYMENMFNGCDILSTINIGPDFSFKGSQSQAVLPTPPHGAPYTGKWIKTDGSYGPYTSSELRDNYTSDMAGTWVWEVNEESGILLYDGNGGMISGANRIVKTIGDADVTLLDENEVQRHHHELTGWNTKADKTGQHYDVGAAYTIPMGRTTILYAEWEDDHKRDYTVKHFQQKPDMTGYTLVDTEVIEANVGSVVIVEPKVYDGFTKPEKQTIEIPDNDRTVVEYYYNRHTYTILFDGNGATSGQMADQAVIGGTGAQIRQNVFQKTGAIFTGWNTEIDGSGKSYVDQSTVQDFDEADNGTITLYAQWLENPNEILTPQNGEIYVKCKAGETIVLQGLPAGTKYSIEEINEPSGWKQTGIVGTNGTISAAQTNNALITNRYEANGVAKITAHKRLDGDDISASQFQFELLDNSGNVLQTVSNGDVDNDKQIINDEGILVSNPYEGTAVVEFAPISYTENDIGKTYTYRIREISGSDEIIYDSSEKIATVSIEDAGNGSLSTSVTYEGESEPVFINEMKPASLEICKNAIKDGDNIEGEEFQFKVELFDKNGEELDGEFSAETMEKSEVTRISHTPNIDDDGNKIGEFESGKHYSDIVTVQGAESIHIDLDYTNPRGYFWMWAQANEAVRTQSWTSSFNPGTTDKTIPTTGPEDDNIILHTSFDFPGDSISLAYACYAYPSDFCPENNGGYDPVKTNYGYYMKVSGLADKYVDAPAVSSGDVITVKSGKSFRITGLPDGATYKITEQPKANWALVSEQDSEGTVHSGTTSTAIFTNGYEEIPYKAEGQAQLHAKKTLIGGTIKDEDGFVFELLDENGEIIQSKNVNQVGSSSSNITFDPIGYTEADAAVPVEYDVQVMMMKNGESVPRVVTLDASTYEAVVDGTKMNVSGAFTWNDEDFAGCDRSQVVISAVPKDNAYSEYTKQLVFDMSDKDSVEFSFNNLEKYVGGQYHYTIREQAGSDDHMKYDGAVYGAKVTVIDSGEGYLQTSVEYEKGDDVVSEAEFKNIRLTDVHIVKKDKDTLEIIAGAKFTIKSGNQYLHSDGTLSETPEEFETDSRGRIDVTNVPAGTYTLHETQAPGGYMAADDIVFTVNEDGTIVNGESVDEVVVLEEIGTHDITLGKSVSGNMGDTSDRFIFTVQFTGDIVPDRLASTFRYADGRVSTYSIIVDESKTLRVALHHNESVTWSGIPHGAEYTITEEAADRNGYVTSATAQIGTVGADKVVRGTLTDNESVTYTNTRDSVVPTGVSYTNVLLLLLLVVSMVAIMFLRRKNRKTIDI